VSTRYVFRVLVVEDFDAYRDVVTSLINRQTTFQVIGEAVDGQEAVEKAQLLKPDVVLMDIGLPKLNGLEAARRIKALVPAPRVIFLTAQSDFDVMEEAFRLGASAFILKTQVVSHLLQALEAAFHRCEASISGNWQGVDEEKVRAAVLAAGCCQSLCVLS
jgi:DNA-binding NarL/FixJ family response regulator